MMTKQKTFSSVVAKNTEAFQEHLRKGEFGTSLIRMLASNFYRLKTCKLQLS